MQRLERALLILTNLAVVVGLVLLVFELRQNRAAIELEYNMSIADTMSDIQMAIATAPKLAELIAKAEGGQAESLDAAERVQLRHLFSGMMDPRLSYYWMKDSDIIPREDWCNVMSFVQLANADDGLRSEMERNATYAKRMVADVDAICGKYVPQPR
jgi:hypothetical protein